MVELRSSIYVLAVLAITTGVLDVLNSSDRLGKYTKYITSLVIVLILLSPLENLVYGFRSVLEETDFNDNVLEFQNSSEIKDALKIAISCDVSTRLNIPMNVFEVEINLSTNKTDTVISSITIKITDKEFNRYSERIEYYIKVDYGCDVTVIQCFEE